MRKVLFLCSGNYYRSRFAEIIFNHHAEAAGLDWRADSRGLSIGRNGWKNDGPLSPHVFAALRDRRLPVPEPLRDPVNATEADLADAALVIAMKEEEHRPRIEEQFPAWRDRVVYWHVHDHDLCEPSKATAQIQVAVQELIERLAQDSARRTGL